MLDLNIKYRKNILKFYFINSSSKELKREFYNDLNYNSNTKRIIDLTISLFLENDYDSENIVRFIFNELVDGYDPEYQRDLITVIEGMGPKVYNRLMDGIVNDNQKVIDEFIKL
jgi:hypothetical protein